MIWELSLTLHSLSLFPRLPLRGPIASTRNIAPLPVYQNIQTADSPAMTDLRLPTTATRLRAYAKRRMSSVTVSARKAVHAPRPMQVPIRRGDGSAVALAQKKDRDGMPAACMAVVPVHGNVSTLLVISRAVRDCLTPPLALRVFFFRNTDCILIA